MPPDLNSLSLSRSSSSSPLQRRSFPASSDNMYNQSPSPRSSSVSLAAAATINAADMSRRSSLSNNRGSPQAGRASERRRSAVAMNLNINDPSLPGPGELSSSDHRSSVGSTYRTASPTSIGGSPAIATGDPHHQRAPSLGEIHQELEQEQEAQVNRLLQMIRTQQSQLQQLRQNQPQQESGSGTTAIDDSTPTSERSISFPSMPPLPTPGNRSSVQLPSSLSNRRGSRPSSQGGTSPALPPISTSHQGSFMEPTNSNSSAEWPISGSDIGGRRSSRDEGAFYQAETAMLTRENQMLKLRIRELERQINDLNASPAHTPATASNLASTPSSATGVETGSASESSTRTGEEAQKA